MDFLPPNYTEIETIKDVGKVVEHSLTKEKMLLQPIEIPTAENMLEVLRTLESDNSKPRSLLRFNLESHTSPKQKKELYLLTEFYPKSFQELIDSSKEKKEPIPFRQLLSFFLESIRVLAYLQSKKIALGNVNPDQFRMDQKLKIMRMKLGRVCSIFPGYSRLTASKVPMEFVGISKYISPELYAAYKSNAYMPAFDPFKSDVFSLGVTFLELSTCSVVFLKKRKHWEGKVSQLIDDIWKIYDPLLKDAEERSHFFLFQGMLRECFEIAEKRPDFQDLFYKSLCFSCFNDHYLLEEKKGSNKDLRNVHVRLVSDSSEENLKVPAHPDMLVKNLKKELEIRTTVAVSLQRLFLGQTQLEDDKTFAELDITDESTLFLIPLKNPDPLGLSLQKKKSCSVSMNIEDFEDITKIAAGSFSSVSRVLNKSSKDQFLAIKMMNTLGLKDEKEIEKEIQTWKRLKSGLTPRAIPSFHGFIKEKTSLSGTNYHLVFDFYPRTLSNLLSDIKKQKKIFPFQRLYSYADDIINAMAFLQTRQLCHRDIKPSNLLINQSEEHIFLIDLGEAKDLTSPESLLQTKKILSVAGTEQYMSPELDEALRSDRQSVLCNPFKSDVFSFGLVFLELGTLELPLRNTDHKVWSQNIATLCRKFKQIYEPTLKNEREKYVLSEFAMILEKCLSLEPKKRPDFYRLFSRSLRYEDPEKIARLILMKEQGGDQGKLE